MHVADKGVRQRGPPLAHDENVVRLLERNAVLEDQAPDASAAVITEIPVEHLHPRLGGEDG
jgi:hypothetical protein